ncbi:hypothetical protein HPG69_002733 [Diceros bicornis minor]|uniref:HIN-200 domain-containing protein n=1 Tax=Diceros bicornis minor TaxID=77932 RepID=A0A7J7FLP6_DICBM|nr:hypothetical protein HPG69_002733 [Diceros bicornis minor]
MKPFKFETQEGKVATESEFFFVKVFNKDLKDNFTPKKIIITSKYYWHTHFLELNSASLVFDARSDQQISINKLQTQPLGTIVNGLFVLQKKRGQRNHILFDLRHNTVRMEVLVLGKQNKIKCEEEDKLRLTFFELSKTGEILQLKSGVHNFIKLETAWRKVSSPRG